jgi:hypothetical protein
MRIFRTLGLGLLASLLVIVPATAQVATQGTVAVGAGGCATSPSCIAFRAVCDPALAPTLSVTSAIIDVAALSGRSLRVTAGGATLGDAVAIVDTLSTDCSEVRSLGTARPSHPLTFVFNARYLVIGAPLGTVGLEYGVEAV